MSTAARALVEDVKARRGSSIPLSSSSPFPDFDRTLQTLSGDDGGFSFNLDPKLADQINNAEELPEFDLSSSIPFRGSYMDAFPALRVVSSQGPSLSQDLGPNHPIYDPSTPRRPGGHYLEKSTSRGSSYVGSFNPFSDSMLESMLSLPRLSQYSPVDEERKVSRFGFARGRRTSTAASSPLQSVSPLTSIVDHHPFHHNTDDIPAHIIQSWQRGHDVSLSLSHGPSPMNQTTHVPPILMQASSQFPSIDSELSEAQLRNFILSSQERANGSGNSRHAGGNSSALSFFLGLKYCIGSLIPSQQFEDPAIMSASYSMPTNHESFAPIAYGPPPGLSAPQRPAPPAMLQSNQTTATDSRNTGVQSEYLLMI
jgi:CCR4-NOT transcription complex subunit 4